MKPIFWIFIAIEALAYLGFMGFALIFAIGSKSNPLAILGMGVGLLLIGALVLGVPVLIYLRSTSNVGRIAALVLVMLPVLLLGVSAAVSAALGAIEGDDRDHFDTSGRLVHFRSGRPRELEAAIVAGDVARATALAQQVKLNQPGHKGATYLSVSARELWRTTNQLQILTLLLDRGADFRLPDSAGHDTLWHAASARHWPAVLLLLQRGADWKTFRTPEGLGFQEYLNSQMSGPANGPALAEVIAFIQGGSTGAPSQETRRE